MLLTLCAIISELHARPQYQPSATYFIPLSDAYASPLASPSSLRLATFRAAHNLGLPRSALVEGMPHVCMDYRTTYERGATVLASDGAKHPKQVTTHDNLTLVHRWLSHNAISRCS